MIFPNGYFVGNVVILAIFVYTVDFFHIEILVNILALLVVDECICHVHLCGNGFGS